MGRNKEKKYSVDGTCIKCHGIGSGGDTDGHYVICTVCNGAGNRYRKPKGPRKVMLPTEAAQYIASYIAEFYLETTQGTIIEALNAYNRLNVTKKSPKVFSEGAE